MSLGNDLYDIIENIIDQKLVFLRHYEGTVMSAYVPDIRQGAVMATVPALQWLDPVLVYPRFAGSMVQLKENDIIDIGFMNGDSNRPVYYGKCCEFDTQKPKSWDGQKTSQVVYEGPITGKGIIHDETLGKLKFLGATLGAARLNDTTLVDSSTDAAWALWWTTFIAGLTVFLTGLNSTTLPAQAAAFLSVVTGNPHPSTITGKINQASSTVVIE